MNDEERSDEIRRLEALARGPAGAMIFPALAEVHRRAGRPEQAERVAREGLEASPQASAGRVALALALLDQKRGDEARRELVRLLGDESEHALAAEAAQAAHEPSASAHEPSAAPAAREHLPGGTREIHGEIATLDPYPSDLTHPSDLELASASDGAEAGPGLALEPPEAGPFGPPPPPAPSEPLVFAGGGVRDEELDSAFDEAESDRDQMYGANDVARAALASVPPEIESAERESEAAEAAGDEESDGLALAAGPGSPFATATVAGLLERQGHGEAAERIRSSLVHEDADEPEYEDAPTEAYGAPTEAHGASPEAHGASPEAGSPAGASRTGAHAHQATLERWLDNLRRDTR